MILEEEIYELVNRSVIIKKDESRIIVIGGIQGDEEIQKD